MSDERAPCVLVVDDEPSIREPLTEYLRANGFTAREAGTAAIARHELSRGGVDIVLLDIMMPGQDGLSFTREVRAAGRLPIILLTAMAEDTDRIVGLEMGADDYITKPFNPRELLARVRAVLRRAEPGAPAEIEGVYAFAGFTLDPEARTLADADGQDVPLTGGEFALLMVLIERAGRVMDRDQLLDLTQGREAHVYDRSVDNQISRLRKKIEIDPKAPGIIKTVRGGGYVLAAKVTKR